MRQDPAFIRTDGEHTGRDGCRIPFPWSARGPSLGFGPTAATWLPQPAVYRELAVDRQEGVPGSTLELYRHLLDLRRAYALGSGSLEWLEAYVDDPDVVAFRSTDGDRAEVTVLVNLGAGAGGAAGGRSGAGGVRGDHERIGADRHGGLVHRLRAVDNGRGGPGAVSSVGACLGMRYAQTTSRTPLR